MLCFIPGFEGALSALPQSAIDQTDRNLSIYLDDVHCLGDEPALSYCIHNGIGVHNCGHYEDASVTCQSMPLIQGPLYTGLSISNPHNLITLCISNGWTWLTSATNRAFSIQHAWSYPLHVLMWLDCACSTSMQVRVAKSWSAYMPRSYSSGSEWSASKLATLYTTVVEERVEYVL